MGIVLNTKKGTGGGGGGGVWGAITGDIDDQTDLQAALGLKAPLASPTFTGTVTTAVLASSAEMDINCAAILMISASTEINFSTPMIKLGGDEVAANSGPVIIDAAFFAGGGTITVSKGFVLAILP